MKCPKCQYVSFEPEARCRHCGYGFSLADADQAARLLEEDGDPADEVADAPAPSAEQSLRHLETRLRAAAATPAPAPASAVPPAARAASAPAPVAVAVPVPVPAPVARPPAVSAADPQFRGPFGAGPVWEPEILRTPVEAPAAELPLFVKAVNATVAAEDAADDIPDAPLVRVPAEPRTPLGVRRPAPDTGIHRTPAQPAGSRASARRLGPLDRDLLEDLQRIERAERDGRQAGPSADGVGALPRLAAAALDAVIIGGLTAGVLWVTLRWLDLPVEQITILPFAPMAAFLAFVGLGYLMMFTAAGGQTIGKMVCGLRVVREEAAAPEGVTFSQAACRVLLSLPSVLALGAGFLPALRGGHQAFHDRLAHTRVVRA